MSAPTWRRPVSPVDAAESLFRSLRREVWIVTAASGIRRGGLTATWVQPVSIDRQRPVLLAALAPTHYTTELVESSGRFVAHLLRADQAGLALRFALSSGRDGDKLVGLPVELCESNVPRLVDCKAWAEVKVFARLDTGARRFYWGDVLDAATISAGPPLVDQELLAAATPDERRILLERLAEDVRRQRPADDAWRGDLPESLRLPTDV